MSDLIDQLIDRYQVVELLGQGGMAYVYKAFDTRLERMVAIKVIRQDAFAPKEMQDLKKRFEREAKSLAKLDHPNIVKIFDYGEYSGAPYLVMQYVGGGSLRERCKEQSIPWHWRKSARLLVPIARALDYAHQQNIIHRDVKTPNILLTSQDVPMLSDFGIAKIVAPGVVATLTGTGVGIGTPEYMAPEQALGRVFPQSDIYSLGIVFFELVTGQLPYSADTPMAVILKHINEPLPLPRRLNSSLPEVVEQILLRALAKRPEERFATAAELAETLENLLQLPDEALPSTRFSAGGVLLEQLEEAETVAAPVPSVGPEQGTGAPVEAPLVGSVVAPQPQMGPVVETVTRAPLSFPHPPESSRPSPAIVHKKVIRKSLFSLRGLIKPVLILLLAFLAIFLLYPGAGLDLFRQVSEIVSPIFVSTHPSPSEDQALTKIPTRSLTSGAQVSTQTEPLKIALLVPLSGSVAGYGISARNGSLLAIEEWNAGGGVLGRRVEVIIEDTQCTDEPAINGANKVIHQDKVHYIIGEVCSKASIPVSKLAQEAGVLMISPSSTNPTVTLNPDGTTKDYVFRACFADPFQATVMAKFAMDRGFKTTFILFNKNDDYSRELGVAFEQSWMQARGRVLGVETYTPDTIDFTEILTKAVYSKADFLWVPDYYYRVNLIASQARQRGVTSVLMGGDGWDSSELDLKVTDGGYFSNHYSPADPRPIVQEWVRKYQAKYGSVPDAIATLSYDATNILLSAIVLAGEDSPDQVKGILSARGFEAVTGWIKFDGHHNPIKPAAIMQIKDGQIVFVTTVQP